MKYLDFYNNFKKYPILSYKEIFKIDPNFNKYQLYIWGQKGYLENICRGYYIFKNTIRNEYDLFLISNHIYEPSYISLESALSFYHVIPESVSCLTAVTTLKTRTIKSDTGNFTYQKIIAQAFTGYRLLKIKNHEIKTAEKEKALIDYLYLHPYIKEENHFIELRINKTELLKDLDENKIILYLNLFNNKELSSRVWDLINFVKK